MSQAASTAVSGASADGDSTVTYSAGPPPWVWLAIAAVVALVAWRMFKQKWS